MFNEEEGIAQFIAEVDGAAATIVAKYSQITLSLVLVDDGSRDRSCEVALAANAQALSDLHVIQLTRNFGHAAAVTALFEEACGYDAMILMDADLQDAPSVLPELVAGWVGGKDSVRVLRGRRGECLLFALLSKMFYRFFERLSGLQSGIGNFGLYDKRVVAAVCSYPERVRYVPGIITLAGYSTQFITVDRRARARGESRVGFRGLFKLAMMALFSFSILPIQAMAAVGFAFSFVAVIGALIAIYVRLFTDLAIPGWASFVTAQFFFGGLTVFCLGVIGQYIGIIFEEVKARPIYLARDKVTKNFKG